MSAVQTVGIVTECMCDLPKKYLRKHNLDIIYFLIQTENGVFTDTDEVTAENILEYMMTNSTMPVSSPPSAEIYENKFRKCLKQYNEVIFISSGAGSSISYSIASDAVKNMGSEAADIYLFDSKHLSTGLGHIIIKAVEMAEAGFNAEKILAELSELRKRVSTSFITPNADYLYRSGHVSRNARKICDMFNIHPVLTMKNGKLALKSIMFGNYEKASLRYVRKELKNTNHIDKSRIFITHAGCSLKKTEQIKNEINNKCPSGSLIVTKASASISCNCGPDTFGVLYVNERKI